MQSSRRNADEGREEGRERAAEDGCEGEGKGLLHRRERTGGKECAQACMRV